MLGIVHRGKPIICLLYIKPNIEQKMTALRRLLNCMSQLSHYLWALYSLVLLLQGRYIWMVIQFWRKWSPYLSFERWRQCSWNLYATTKVLCLLFNVKIKIKSFQLRAMLGRNLIKRGGICDTPSYLSLHSILFLKPVQWFLRNYTRNIFLLLIVIG